MLTVTQPSTRTCTLLHRQSHGPTRPGSEPDGGKVRSGQARRRSETVSHELVVVACEDAAGWTEAGGKNGKNGATLV